jgi:hypothetical protein
VQWQPRASISIEARGAINAASRLGEGEEDKEIGSSLNPVAFSQSADRFFTSDGRPIPDRYGVA